VTAYPARSGRRLAGGLSAVPVVAKLRDLPGCRAMPVFFDDLLLLFSTPAGRDRS